MKVRRYKKARGIITFFKKNFGFRAPFQVVLDGTFCQIALTQKVNLREQIPKYLGDEVRLLTTSCVLNELENLGKVFNV